jgi:NDP-sugar pyrophosphorylase family protein/CheY-like chemotaxis protein
MQAIILAGGQGTRLRPLTYTVPKPMLPVANRPAMAHALDHLAAAGCEDVIITTNYLAEYVAAGICGQEWPLPVRCVKEEKPLGTAGCVKNMIELLGDEFIVVQGDAVADINYRALLEFHHQHEADVTITVMEVGDTREFGIVAIDEEGRIERFQEKPRPEEAFSNLANVGFYVLKKSVFDHVPRDQPFDFSNDLFPLLMQQGARFFAFKKRGYWVDIGRVHNYLQGNQMKIEGRAEVAEGVIVPPTTTLVPPFLIGAGVHLGEQCTIGPNTVVGAHSAVGDGTQISGSVLMADVQIGAGCHLHDCVIASRARLRADVSVGALAVIGEECEIGAGAQVNAHSRVGPATPVAPGTVVDGVVSPRMEKIAGLQEAAGSGALSPLLAKLSPEQRDVYVVVSEFGEMTAPQIADATALPLKLTLSVLESLEARGTLLSTTDVPRRYALKREELHTSRRVLFVDDVNDTREFFNLVFNMQGHSVQCAADGLGAVAAVQQEKFDLIIMDVEMPGIDGWEAVRRIRRLPNGGETPIVMFTARENDGLQEKVQEVDANGLLQKPMLPQELLSHVAEYLQA